MLFILTLAAAAVLDRVLTQAKRELGLPDATPTILTGFSRGSNLVVFSAGDRDLQRHLLGGIAVALTREADNITEPDPARRTPELQVDDQGRLQTYPAIKRLGALPFAVIQSAGDSYVPAGESRRLFGPDTPTRRLYEVDAKDHAFHGGHIACAAKETVPKQSDVYAIPARSHDGGDVISGRAPFSPTRPAFGGVGFTTRSL